MLWLLVYALVPVVLGAAIALAPGVSQRLFRPVHTFAFGAAVTIVLADLLPGAVIDAGPLSLLVFGAALVAPSMVDRWARSGSAHGHDDGAGMELAFAGLLVHQVVDGLQIGTSAVFEHGHNIVLAVALHTFPLVAVAVLAYAHHDGRRVALRRTAALLIATTFGVLAGEWLLGGVYAYLPWVSAAIAGVLLYMLGHDLPARPPERYRDRAVELIATIAGMCLPLAWGHGHTTFESHPQVAAGVIGALGAVLVVQILWFAGVVPRRFVFAREADHTA